MESSTQIYHINGVNISKEFNWIKLFNQAVAKHSELLQLPHIFLFMDQNYPSSQRKRITHFTLTIMEQSKCKLWPEEESSWFIIWNMQWHPQTALADWFLKKLAFTNPSLLTVRAQMKFPNHYLNCDGHVINFSKYFAFLTAQSP